MKIRIKDSFIRLRLTKTEVEQLVKQGSVAACAFFPIGNELIYQLTTENNDDYEAVFRENKIKISVPQSLVKEWDINDVVGFDHEFENGLKILIEKDFKCLTPRDEDESDHFENPLDSHNC